MILYYNRKISRYLLLYFEYLLLKCEKKMNNTPIPFRIIDVLLITGSHKIGVIYFHEKSRVSFVTFQEFNIKHLHFIEFSSYCDFEKVICQVLL